MKPMNVQRRLDQLEAAFADAGIQALLVTNVTNIRYLTGFTGSTALLLVRADGKTIFCTDGRYGLQAEQQMAAAQVYDGVELVVGGGAKQKETLSAAVSAGTKVGLEATNVTWAQQRRFASDWYPTAEMVPTNDLVEQLRLVKDDGEIDRLGRAASIADDAFAAVLPMLANGPTEAEFALALDFEMRRLGADDISFDTIVASGLNGAKAHHHPSDRPIGVGELIVCDFGALVDGYHSDMTRSVCVGQPGGAILQQMWDVVIESQAAGVAEVRAGVTPAAIDKVCRDLIEPTGWGDTFTHSTGHGVGLDIHEAPSVAASSTAPLTVGQVITVEPGVYLPEHGGVRIEDTVVVTADGCEVLTRAPKQLVVA